MSEPTFQTALRCLHADDVDQFSTLVSGCPKIATTVFACKFGYPITLIGELISSYHMSASNKLAALQILLELGAEPDPPQTAWLQPDSCSQRYSVTPLAIALNKSDVDIIAQLRTAGASFDYVYKALTYRYLIGINNEGTKFCGHSNRDEQGCIAQLDYLESIGFNLVSWEQGQSQSFLQHVVEALNEESLDIIERLLKYGVDVDGAGGVKTALYTALEKNWYDTAQVLLDQGANLELWLQSIASPVAHHLAERHHAMPEPQLSAVTRGQSLSVMHCDDRSITSALHQCISCDNLYVASWLLANGAHIDACATNLTSDVQSSGIETGDTPIFTAIRNENRKAIELLIKQGARLDVCNAEGDGPLDVARDQTRFKGVIKLLEKAGAIAYRQTEPNKTGLPDRSDLLLLLDAGEPWSDAALEFFSALGTTDANCWHAFLTHCIEHRLTAPNKKWLATTATLMENIGKDLLRERIISWLKLVPEKRTDLSLDDEQFSSEVYLKLHKYCFRPTDQMITAKNTRMLVGLLWSASLFSDDAAASPLATIARSMYRKVPKVGMRNAKVANAATNTLTLMGENGLRQVVQLTRLLDYSPALTNLHRILNKAVKTQGIKRELLDRLVVPNLPIDNDGTHVRQIGEHTAVLSFPTILTAHIEWLREDSKRQKSVPTSVKNKYAKQLAELKDYKKQLVDSMRSEQRRIERTWLTERAWTMDEWRAEFIDPESVGRLLARRLIWTLSKDSELYSAMPTANGWVDRKGNSIEARKEHTVQLWHPADSASTEIVRDWKERILALRITQPFAQAHREVYVPIDTELCESGDIQRFSGQVVRHHQFHVLAEKRGWSHTLLGNWDGGRETEARLYISSANVIAELNTQPIETGSTAHEIWPFLMVGKLQIVGTDNWDQVDLKSIPRRLFSEILRDVDLLVSVPNAGRTADWESLGIDECYRPTWTQFAGGKLGGSASVRLTVLEKLLPKLPFADHCLLTDRYLLVTGSLGEYRIHLGSGNVTMYNGNRSLVISSTTDASKDIFTPFEGDRILGDILTKARMLAADGKIRNKQILEQIRSAD